MPSISKPRWTIPPGVLIAAVLVLLCVPGRVATGGGPENVVVVVNRDSPSSLLLANHYIDLRKIPAVNVIYLSGVPDTERTGEVAFRTKILQPVFRQIAERGLEDHIDYIVYSSGFPTLVYMPAMQKRLVEVAKQRGQTLNEQSLRMFMPHASSTSMTYFAKQVLQDDPSFMALNANRYMRTKNRSGEYLPTRSFHSRLRWRSDGQTTDAADSDPSYFISTVLGVTRGTGMSEAESLDYLKRTVQADGHPPAGTFFFSATADIRTKVRQPLFADAIAGLREMNLKTRVIRETIPKNAVVAGLVTGCARFDWSDSGSEISPGAICDNLTSIGGSFDTDLQTKCTEFLKAGAAGSCGTVIEPFAVPAKFPHPMMHVHYARGCTLGEAFYQSLHGPYQLLVVGDPLCRPWAQPPRMEVSGLVSGAVCSGDISATIDVDNEIATTEIWLDGKLLKRNRTTHRLDIDSTRLADGYHELRVIGLTAGPVEFRTSRTIPFTVSNRGETLSLSARQTSTGVDGSIVLEVDSGKGRRFEIFQNNRRLASGSAGQSPITIQASDLGRGPVTLTAKSWTREPAAIAAISPPLKLTVTDEPSR